MALVVEDGTALANAESFISVASATQYHSDRNNTAWALLTTPVMESSLRQAADYMEQVYRERWAGYRTTGTQALSWPRTLVPQKDAPGGYRAWPFYYPTNVVPMLVGYACASLALRASVGPLSPDLGRFTTKEKVDVIEVDYLPGARQTIKFREIDNMLAIFFDGQAGSLNGRLLRA